MRIICLTFTYPKDARRAAFHAQLLPSHWRKIWCVEPAHAGMPVPAGVEKLVRDFPRGQTLRHDAAILGMRDVYLDLSKQCDALVKLDSDTALFRPEAFEAPIRYAESDFVYVRRLAMESRLLCNGCCYAVSKKALRRLAGKFDLSLFPEQFGGHEDLIFSAFWAVRHKDLSLCQINKLKWSWCEVPYIAADAFGAHNGYVSEIEDFNLCRKILAASGRSSALADIGEYAAELAEWEKSLTPPPKA